MALVGVAVVPVAAATASPAGVRDDRVTATVVPVTADRYYGHVEPDVAVSPRNPKDLIGACQFEVGAHQRLPGTFASFDGGRSWRDNGVLRLPAGYEQGADTTVSFDARGNGFVAALMSHGGGGYASRVVRGGIFVWKTTNGGRSFSKPRAVFVGAGFQDHPWLAVGATARGSALYLAWTNRSGLVFTSSRDDGRSFAMPHVLVAGSGPADPVVTVGRGGLVRVLFEEFALPAIRLRVIASRDGGATFGRPATIATVSASVSGGGPKGAGAPPPLLAASTDPASGVTAVGIAAFDGVAGHPVAEVWESTTGGRWRGAFRPATGTTTSLAQQQPRLVMARGELYVSYFAVTRTGEISAHLAAAPEARSTFAEIPLGSTPFRSNAWLGDYQALAIQGRYGYALWNDGGSGRLQIAAARFSTSR